MADLYSVGEVSGASYGFALNSDGYYESQNKGVNSSAALCVVTFNMPTSGTVYFDCINYAEANYDYGILGNIDGTLSTSYTADSTYYHRFYGKSMSTVQTVSYTMESGTHTIYVKFRKDSSVSSNNDSLQFQVRVELDAPPLMLKVDGAWTQVQAVYKKVSGSWIEQSDVSGLFDTNAKYKKMN